MIELLDVPFLDMPRFIATRRVFLCLHFKMKWWFLPTSIRLNCLCSGILMRFHKQTDPIARPFPWWSTYCVHFSRSLFIFIFIYVSNTSSILEPLCENELAQLLAMRMPHHHHVHIYFIRKNFNWLIKLHCLEKSPIKAQDSSNFCPGKHKRSS